MKRRCSCTQSASLRLQNLNLLSTKIQGNYVFFFGVDQHSECLFLPCAARSSRKIAAVSLMDGDMSWALAELASIFATQRVCLMHGMEWCEKA